MSFIGAIQQAIADIGPWFIKNKNIGTFIQAASSVLDSAAISLDEGLRLSQPLRGDVSALEVLAKDRGIRLYGAEPIASQRVRLASWLPLHRQRGTHQGEMRHSQPYFLPDIPMFRIVHQAGNGISADWHTLDGTGTYTWHRSIPSNWNYDGQTAKWSRFWCILYAPSSVLHASHWDDGGHWDGGGVYDGVFTATVADMVAMIKEWKAPHSRLAGYIIATDPASFNPAATAVTDPTGWTSLPVGNWGAPITGPPASHFTRLPSALWVYEDNP